jgi:hypothetical protein
MWHRFRDSEGWPPGFIIEIWCGGKNLVSSQPPVTCPIPSSYIGLKVASLSLSILSAMMAPVFKMVMFEADICAEELIFPFS